MDYPQNNFDERLGLPSGSTFEILVACPGQPNLVRSLPALPAEEPDELAQIGTLIHAARETGDTSELDDESKATYEAGLKYEQKLVGQWVLDRNLTLYSEGPREQRLWLHDPQSGDRVLSAKLDVQYNQGSVGRNTSAYLLVVDWKTGWSWALTPSQRNWQLRVQAVLAWREYDGVESVRVAFIKPLATSDRLDFTDYNTDDLRRSQELIFQHLWASRQPDAPRHAGPHCNYCPAKAYCREAAAYSLLPSVMTPRPVPEGLTPVEITALVNQMPLADVALLKMRTGIVLKILEAANDRLRKQTDADLDSVGLKRKQGRNLDPLVRPKEMFEFLKSFGVDDDEIWSALSFSKGELTDALRRAFGWSKDSATQFIKFRLQDFTEKKRAEDSIVSI